MKIKILTVSALFLSITSFADPAVYKGPSNSKQFVAAPGAQAWTTVSAVTFSLTGVSPLMVTQDLWVSNGLCRNPTRVTANQKNPACDKDAMAQLRVIVKSAANPMIVKKVYDYSKTLNFGFVNHPINVGYLDAGISMSSKDHISINLGVPALPPGTFTAELQVSFGHPNLSDAQLRSFASFMVEAHGIEVVVLK